MLKYGGVSGDEQECTIRLDAQEGTAHVFSSWPVWSRRLEKRYGVPKRTNELDDFVTGAWWVIPLKAISLRGLPQVCDPSRVAKREMPVGGWFGKNRLSSTSQKNRSKNPAENGGVSK